MNNLQKLKHFVTNVKEIKKTILIVLDEWSIVSVEGNDSTNYLQGQFTKNIKKLHELNYFFCAHCNHAGKVLSNMIVFTNYNGYIYIQRKSICNVEIFELKKYAIFSQVTIYNNNNYVLLGVLGGYINNFLKNCFEKIPNKSHPIVRFSNETYILLINDPFKRFLIIMPIKKLQKFFHKFQGQFLLSTNEQWKIFDIQIGLPILDEQNIAKFIPLEINLENFNSIDYTKGCYQGQEIITRTKFRKNILRNIYWLIGTAQKLPCAGTLIESNTSIGWSVKGKVLSAIWINQKKIWIQSVLKSHLLKTDIFRIYNDINSQFFIYKIFI
ncbi:tRNA-modifying protein [Buchnera aphidicola (Nipponaphis monzeni)]|uniref:tRNA-modifying protein n=1 Tax=Buchnera aphidicola (Nipponaphis monzeni) TaxID=2495405 RepID=A0A455TAI6_9GAMM|nr:tRNA-modifying protein YgfZ [Buchnera aphidicola]BBI01332.1 tRNA-modifying protein [Buchnera aphidicola (Nipponaphis monzeni)]